MQMRKCRFYLRLIIFITPFYFIPLWGQTQGTPGQHVAVRLSHSGTVYGYYLYLPKTYQQSDSAHYPLILFFHGLGEHGNGENELSRVLLHGPPKRLHEGYDLPAIVISPQSHTGSWKVDEIDQFLNHILRHFPVDPGQVYLTGLSKGGGAVWEYMAYHPSKVKAAIPVAGAFDYQEDHILQDSLDGLKRIPVWAFHSFHDPVVPRQHSIHNVDVLADIGSSVEEQYPFSGPEKKEAADTVLTFTFREPPDEWQVQEGIVVPEKSRLALTIYPATGHDSWTATYDNDAVYAWLLSHHETPLMVYAGEDTVYEIAPDTLKLAGEIINNGGSTIRETKWRRVGGPEIILIPDRDLSSRVTKPISGTYLFEFSAENVEKGRHADTIQVEIRGEFPTGRHGEEGKIIHFWPNPSPGVVQGVFKGETPYQILIYSMDQKQLIRKTFSAPDFMINLDMLQPGVYLFLLESENYQFTKRIIRD